MKNVKCPHCGGKAIQVICGYALAIECHCLDCKKKFTLVKGRFK